MRVRVLLHISIVTLTAVIGTVPVSADPMTTYDVSKAETWADALAICDVTRFLLSEPNLDAEVIISPMPGNVHVPLYKPYFIPPSSFYSDAMRETFERVQKAGQVNTESYGQARMRYTKLMLPAYRYASGADRAFLADQMKTCYALAVDTTGKARNIKSDTNR